MPLPKAQLVDLDDPLRGRSAARAGATPAATSELEPTPADDPRATHPPPSAPARSRRHRQPPRTPAATSANAPVDPYHGSPKIAVNMRATKALWDQLGDVVRELEQQGHRTSRTEITEALWHLHGPRSADEAATLILRYQLARRGHRD